MTDSPSPKRYLVRFADGTEIGPLDKQAIKAMAKAGRLSADDSISQEGSGKWVKVSQVPGLMPSDSSPNSPSETPCKERSTPSGVPRRTPSSDDDSPTGIPKGLLYGLGAIAAIVVIATTVWFIVEQRQQDAIRAAERRQQEALRAEEQRREVATRAFQSAIETANAIPDSAPLDDVIARLDATLAVVDQNQAMVTLDSMKQVEPLRARRAAAIAKRDWQQQAAALLKEMTASDVEARVEVRPAKGLFASDPNAAMTRLRKLVDDDNARQYPLFGHWNDALEDRSAGHLLAGLSDSLRFHRISKNDYDILLNEIMLIGCSAQSRKLDAKELAEWRKKQAPAFEARIASLRQSGAGLVDARTLTEAIDALNKAVASLNGSAAFALKVEAECLAMNRDDFASICRGTDVLDQVSRSCDEGSEKWNGMLPHWIRLREVFEVFRDEQPPLTKENFRLFVEGVNKARAKRNG